ncbi:MAG: class I SAM-dependent methyltransferase [Thermoproteota archaeon]
MRSLGEEHFARIWARKSIRAYVPGSNLRVEAAARILRPGRRFLDVGCGDGLLGTLVQDRFEEIWGVDISDQAIELAKRRGIKAYKVNLNVEGLPFEDGYFDSITCLSTLQLIYDVIFALRECNRVLRPSGELILAVPNMRSYWRIFKLVVLGDFPRTSCDSEGYDGGTLHYFCYRNLRNLLSKTGFKVEMHKGIFCRPRLLEKVPDWGWVGKIKAEFLSGEMLVRAVKMN